MKKYSLKRKLQACRECNKHEEKVGFFGIDGCYCNEVGTFVEEINGCTMWDNYWKEKAKITDKA